MLDKSSYKIFTDKVVYEPKDVTTQKAIKDAGRISAFEGLPVELRIQGSVFMVRINKLKIERVK